ncbi:MAG: hypothetical protein DRH08_10450, partial [Deltaproteobacteria bacterium]
MDSTSVRVIFFSLILALSAFFPASAKDSKHTLQQYLASYHVRDISMTMDGSKIAFIHKGKDKLYSLVIADIDQNYKILSKLTEKKDQKITKVRWISQDHLAITITSQTTIFRTSVNLNRLVIIDAEGKGSVGVLAKSRWVRRNFDLSQIASILPKDPDHILIYAYDNTLSLYKVNIHTGEGEKFLKGGGQTIAWRFNEEGDPQLRIDFASVSKKVKFYVYDKKQEKWHQVMKFHFTDLEEEIVNLAGLQGESEILMLDRKDNDNFIGLYKYDIQDQQLTDLVANAEGYDLHRIVSDTNSGKVLGANYIADRPRYIYLDKEVQVVQDKLEQLFPNGVVMILSVSDAQKRFLFYTNTPWNPGAYYIFERDTESIIKIADLLPGLAGDAPTFVDIFKYKTPDGMQIEGYLTFPSSTEPKNLPMIVLPHGGPHARDWLRFDVFTQYLASRGYVVFQPNYRGSTGYGKQFEEAGYQEYGGRMIDDIAAGIRAVAKAGYANPDRICSAGLSYGGTASLMLAAKTDLLKCVISINGPTDWIMRIKNGFKKADRKQRDELREWYDMALGNINSQKELLEQHSPVTYAKEIFIPILLIHAKDDQNVAIKHSEKMNKYLEHEKKDVRYVELDTGGHSLMWGHA